MGPMLENVQGAVVRASRHTVSTPVALRQRAPFVCFQCRYQATKTGYNAHQFRKRSPVWQETRRGFNWTATQRQDEVKKIELESKPVTPAKEVGKQRSEGTPPTSNGTIHAAENEQLPSHRERIRWRASKYMNQLMDDLMPKLALASQRINTFTGTDYSGIESLRKEIIEQEQLVKTRHAAMLRAKESLEGARTSESQSRKEVVSLLERRHSWTDHDLERYMSLIRSEHLNDQEVQTAKDIVNSAEKSLEEARNKLEKMERMQYHEEQIWSDTIRRNSTWVTFGLMGVNILLLLVTMGIVEPWRRKRMVGEIKRALEENKVATTAVPAIEEAIARELDQVIEPQGLSLEALETTEATSTTTTSLPEPPSGQELPEDIPQEEIPGAPMRSEAAGLDNIKDKISDLFSERTVTVRKVDLSTVALEGAAAGAALVVIFMTLLRPR